MARDRCLIGVDIGTTGTKAVLFSAGGALLAKAYAPYPAARRQAGRHEQNPEHWWAALCATVREVARHAPAPEAVAALAIATQGGTVVPADPQGRALHPAIVWNDKRGDAQRDELAQTPGEQAIFRRTGWRLGPGLNAVQILWLRHNRPDVFAKTARFLSVPDYMSQRLTGRAVIDPSNGGINQLLNIDSLQWDAGILQAIGILPEQLADIAPSGRPVGRLCATAAEALGLPCETLLVTGGHDQYCAALGAGALREGDVLLATGTCWVLVGIGSGAASRLSRSRHVVEGLWGNLLSMENGGDTLEWFRRLLAPAEGAPSPYSEINRAVSRVPAGAQGIRFYPYFAGAPYPEPAPAMRAAFLGLGAEHGRGAMARAIMEGVCLQAKWSLEAFPAPHSALRMTGGAANSPPWVQMMADIAALPVTVPQNPEAGCTGAAILAGVGAGLFPDCAAGLQALGGAGHTVLPGADSAAYQALYERYKRGFWHLRQCAE